MHLTASAKVMIWSELTGNCEQFCFSLEIGITRGYSVRMSDIIKQRFNAKWRKDKSGCWIWTASTAGKGYGQFRLPGTRKNVYAHRMSWELRNGPVPAGKLVCHECDNPICVNPAHLFLGDAEINLKDMAAKGRHLYGERNAQAKLTERKVKAIHNAAAKGESQRSIADRFGVGAMTVNRILKGTRWRHAFEARRRKK